MSDLTRPRTVTLRESQWLQLDVLAVEDQRSVSSLLRLAVEQFLGGFREDEPVRESRKSRVSCAVGVGEIGGGGR